jgi:hypothetical protein
MRKIKKIVTLKDLKFGKNKYNATHATYRSYTYDSHKEMRYAMWLDSEIEAGRIKGYERQPQFSFDINGVYVCSYKPDFLVYHNDGVEEIAEVKGVKTREFMIKWKLLKALYGTKYRLTIVTNI